MISYGPFTDIVRKQAAKLRPSLYDEDRKFQWPIAVLRVALPGIVALLCYFALTPQEWNVGDSWIRVLNNLKILWLILMVITGSYAVLMAAAGYDVHQTGWTPDAPKQAHALEQQADIE